MRYHAGNQLVDPVLVLEKVQLQKGMALADFGCGSLGHLVFPAADIVGERGLVYAVDIDQGALAHIERRIQSENAPWVHTLWSDIERLGGAAIAEHSLDVVTMTNVLCRLSDRTTPCAEAARLLKEKGRVLVVDWKEESLSFGPQGVSVVDTSLLEQTMQTLGFVLQEEFSVGPYHFGQVYFRQL